MALVPNGTFYASGRSQELDNFVPFFSPEELAVLAATEREKGFTTGPQVNLKNRKPVINEKSLVSSDLPLFTLTVLLDWFLCFSFLR